MSSIACRFSQLGKIIGRTEESIRIEKEAAKEVKKIKDQNVLEKLKKHNSGKDIQLENHQRQIEKLKDKIAKKDSEIVSLQKKILEMENANSKTKS